jgi:hypothetical protein
MVLGIPGPFLGAVVGTLLFFRVATRAGFVHYGQVFFLPDIPLRGMLLGGDVGRRDISDIESVLYGPTALGKAIVITTRQGDVILVRTPPAGYQSQKIVGFLTLMREELTRVRGFDVLWAAKILGQ